MANGKNKKKKWIIGGVIVFVLVLVVVGVGMATSGGAKIDPTKIAAVEKGDLAKSVVATGKVEPITKVEIKSKASGIVKKLYVEYGDKVKAGQLLAELDKDEIIAQVRSQKAQLESAESNMHAAEADYERSKVDAAGVDIPTLQRAYERAKSMAKDGVVSQSALDDSQRAYEMATNKQNVARAQVTVNKAKEAQAQADVQKAQATLAQLNEQLSYTTIVAPIDGIVLSRDVEVGDAVSSILVLGSSATLVMTLGDTSEVYVKGKVDESDIAKVYIGEAARIKVESFKDKTFQGKVTKISPMGVEKDNVTTFEVRVSINNPGGELKAAMTANAEIILEEHKNVLMIPEGAIIYDREKKASVETPDPKAKDGKKKVAVQIGISNGAKTEVLSGLKEKDQVVLQ
ncbi:secretion protein HlyD [Candidatus Koribacter versatilis Ellin345]|uniref:Secretion protein HlyD n=1 Tax=Koribacter versatilis (strain Ellin345) TaxID=204669 RepID=Q1IKR8_KORVE|nr:efflux RND transporter periplasmic adaptor subunit [Candidatus Koribacter versatilis]ABF42532.1 secretion protein HlyD [Candidatus Koribacter versatilis Ellin345]